MTLEIETDYATKIFFPTSSFVQVYFEAVANAFDAEATEVVIHIKTDPLEVTVRDNGCGFTDVRFERFAKLMEPSDQYHKGVGRLVYLKYFSKVDVDSVFKQKRRTFTFSDSEPAKGKPPAVVASESSAQKTTLHFGSFRGERLSKKDIIKPEVVKRLLLSEFLPLLHHKKRGSQEFRIEIELETSSGGLFPDVQCITPTDVPHLDCVPFHDPSRLIPTEIRMYYEIRRGDNAQFTAVCIDGRAIPIHLLTPSAVPADCAYTFLFESDLFAGKSDSSRQRLDLPKDMPEVALLSLLRKQMGSVLSEKLPEIVERNLDTKRGFEDRYPHLTGLFEEETVGIIDRNEAIEGAQRAFFKTQREVLDSESTDDATFSKTLDVSSRALTEYILYRDKIIKQLRAMKPSNKEADIHHIIVPQRRTFAGGALVDGIYNNNAWLLDDKFMSFRVIMSEGTMDDVIDAIAGERPGNSGRPDIAMIFNGDPTTEQVDVVVVEIKKRDAGEKENFYTANQLVDRAEALAKYWPSIQRIWYFGVMDVDEDFSRKLIKRDGWIPLFSKGRTLYKEYQVDRPDGTVVPTPVFLVSYETIIDDAATRNHTFLELLKSDFKRTKLR